MFKETVERWFLYQRNFGAFLRLFTTSNQFRARAWFRLVVLGSDLT